MKKAPTPKQKALLTAIETHTKQHGRPPSYKELQQTLGYTSTASIWRFVQALKKKGLLENESSHWYSLHPLSQSEQQDGSSSFLDIELIGHIVREKPPVLFAKTIPFQLPAALVNHKAGCYGLIIEDTSYRDVHLLPHDLLIVEPRDGASETINPGELVIASHSETIIGHLFDEGEIVQFRSSPYSTKTIHDNFIRIEASSIHIWGVIIASIRSLAFLSHLKNCP